MDCNEITFFSGAISFVLVVCVFAVTFLTTYPRNEVTEKSTDVFDIFKKVSIRTTPISSVLILCLIVMLLPQISSKWLERGMCGEEIKTQQSRMLDKILELNNQIFNKADELKMLVTTDKKIPIKKIDGEYFYRSSIRSKDVRHKDEMLNDENGDPAYMLIGDLSIDGDRINATRYYAVRLVDSNRIKPESSKVDWTTNHMFSKPDGEKNQVIYKLTSEHGKNPVNEGFFIGSTFSRKNAQGKEEEGIKGKMHYMMNTTKTWLIADKILLKKDPDDKNNVNPFLDKNSIEQWFKENTPIELQEKNLVFESIDKIDRVSEFK